MGLPYVSRSSSYSFSGESDRCGKRERPGTGGLMRFEVPIEGYHNKKATGALTEEVRIRRASTHLTRGVSLYLGYIHSSTRGPSCHRERDELIQETSYRHPVSSQESVLPPLPLGREKEKKRKGSAAAEIAEKNREDLACYVGGKEP